MNITARCRPIEQSIRSLEAEKKGYQDQLRDASPGEKPFLTSQIKKLNQQLAETRRKLAQCQGIEPAPSPLPSTLSGTATLTTTLPQAPGPYVLPMTIDVRFTGDRGTYTRIAMTSFPQLQFPVGPVEVFGQSVEADVIITKHSGGEGSYRQGDVSIPITLQFSNSANLTLFDSVLPLTLGTSAPGFPVNMNRTVRLVDSGVFAGGVALDGRSGTLVVDGSFSRTP